MGQALAARDDRELFLALQSLPFRTGLAAPPPPAQAERPGSATASIVLGIVALVILFLSFSLLSFVSLPMAAVGWGLGRSARRSATAGEPWRSAAQTGEIVSIVGTVLSSLAVVWWIVVISANT